MAATVTSLRTQGEFARCYRTGRRASNELLRLYAVPHSEPPAGRPVIRIGAPVSRRVGNAVRRNRMRRVLREAFRHLVTEAKGNWDVVVVPQPQAARVEAQALRGALRDLLAAVGLT